MDSIFHSCRLLQFSGRNTRCFDYKDSMDKMNRFLLAAFLFCICVVVVVPRKSKYNFWHFAHRVSHTRGSKVKLK